MSKRLHNGLTVKMEKFAVCLAQGMSQADAYRFAYDAENMADKTIWEKASVLASDGKVSERVEALLEEAAAEVRLSRGYVLSGLMKIAGKEDAPEGARARAYELLGKEQGMFIDRSHVVTDNRPVSELEAELYEIEHQLEVIEGGKK